MKFVFKCDVIIINDRLLPLRVPAHKTHLLPLSAEEEYQEQITPTRFFTQTEKKYFLQNDKACLEWFIFVNELIVCVIISCLNRCL